MDDDNNNTTTPDTVNINGNNYIDAKITVNEANEIWSSRRKMTWLSLFAMIATTLYILIFIHDATVLEQIATLMSWYYLSLASVVCSYFGFKSWASIKGK